MHGYRRHLLIGPSTYVYRYNVIGTLQDQMTYPDTSGAEQLTEERLREILVEVNLEHLVTREGALTDEVNWEDELSLVRAS